MSHVRLDSNEFRTRLNLREDSIGQLDLGGEHRLWNSNVAAASHLWQLEFLAVRARILILDTAYRGPGTIKNTIEIKETPAGFGGVDPWWHEPARGVTFLRVGVLLGREVLMAATHEGGIYIWRTLALLKGNLKPWFHMRFGDSKWGLDLHDSEPFLAFSDDSGSITLYKLGYGPDDELELVRRMESPYLGGKVVSLCFFDDCIGYTVVTLEGATGSFGLLNMATLDPFYSVATQQPAWSIAPVKNYYNALSIYELCGSNTTPNEFDVLECKDANQTSYILDLEADRLGLQSHWVQPQTWVREHQKEYREWVRHGRRKSHGRRLEDVEDDDTFFIATATHAFMVDVCTGRCIASAERALMPPGIMPGPAFDEFALSILEVIQPLGIAILASRAATVFFLRFTRYNDFKAFRQDLVLCDFSDFVVGISHRPAVAHDFEYDLQTLDLSTEPEWKEDLPNRTPIHNPAAYLVRLHTSTGQVVSFLLKQGN